MNKKFLSLLSMLVLSSSFVSSAREIEGMQQLDNNPEFIDDISDDNKQNTSVSTREAYKFESQWVNSVYDIIKNSNEQNKKNVKDSEKNTYSNTLCYNYSIGKSNISVVAGGGTIYYDGGYQNFDYFRKDVFIAILRHFLTNRAEYLCYEILKKQKSSADLSSECDELKDIIEVFAENGFELIVERTDLSGLKLTLN